MAVAFPDLKPTKRKIQQGRYPTKRFVAMNGASTTRIYGDKATEASLELEFIVDDTDRKQLLDCFENAYGAYDELTLSTGVFDGTSSNVFASYLKWHWVEAPGVSSVQPDLSRVTVKLIGLLEA